MARSLSGQRRTGRGARRWKKEGEGMWERSSPAGRQDEAAAVAMAKERERERGIVAARVSGGES